MTLINTGGTALSGSSVSITSIPGTYEYLQLILVNATYSTSNNYPFVRLNADSNTRYAQVSAINAANASFNTSAWECGVGSLNTSPNSFTLINIYGYKNTTTWKMGQTVYLTDSTTTPNFNAGIRQHSYNQTAAVTELSIGADSGTFTGGTAFLYGVK